jgi:solute carrier family 6 (neurotransmitter transporter, glycine) member 5/9
MEMVLGQFSSSNSVRAYNSVPVLRGVGMGQVIATCFVATYYSSIMAITLRYLFDSFQFVLPWSECRPEWGPCIASGGENSLNATWTSDTKSSAELYFV